MKFRANFIKICSQKCELMKKSQTFAKIALKRRQKRFDEILLNCWNWSGAKECTSCRSRKIRRYSRKPARCTSMKPQIYLYLLWWAQSKLWWLNLSTWQPLVTNPWRQASRTRIWEFWQQRIDHMTKPFFWYFQETANMFGEVLAHLSKIQWKSQTSCNGSWNVVRIAWKIEFANLSRTQRIPHFSVTTFDIVATSCFSAVGKCWNANPDWLARGSMLTLSAPSLTLSRCNRCSFSIWANLPELVV